MWLMPAAAEPEFKEVVRSRHRDAYKALEERNLRRYEKGVYQLFDVRCWPAESPDGFCAECHRMEARTASTSLGELRMREEVVDSAVEAEQCFAKPDDRPKCLLAVQKMSSEQMLSAQPFQGQDDD